jgi:serine/threonine protein kinase
MASYRILRKLGEGGQGVVFEAEQVDLGRRVALKRLRRELRYDPSVVERFLREARMCAAIQHPNVVTIYETGQDDDGPFIAFELLEGESLETKVTREGPQPLASIGTVAEQILLALEEAHAKNLVHRDIKPANVFLSPRRRGLVTKLLDFGVAKGSRDYGSRLTMPGDVVGSLAFMAPEQINDAGVDARTDLYSVGVCLYFMLAGVRPFVGASTGELLLSLDRPPLPRGPSETRHADGSRRVRAPGHGARAGEALPFRYRHARGPRPPRHHEASGTLDLHRGGDRRRRSDGGHRAHARSARP